MICAEDEIGLGDSHDGIMVLDDNAKAGTSAADYFKIETDYVYEIGLTPNRADATSHIGTARDLVAVLNRFFPENKKELRIPDVSEFKTDNQNLPFEIIIESADDCPRYTGLTISDVKVGPSPEWLQNKLKAVGLRPINNIVDITNFVLMETGHPLHAFDYDKIEGKKIIIKKVAAGTKFTTLDEVERELTAGDLMICDSEKPMCMAGIFGGNDSGVTEDTVNVFLESAYFNPVTIRKSSKYHGLKTDASFRFERGADPNITVYAIKRAALLIKEIAGGKISSEISDKYPKPINNWDVSVKYSNIEKLTGKKIPKEIIKSILEDLDIIIKSENNEGMLLEIPTFKVDVTREVDVIEEILRIYGYNNIETGNKIKSTISYTKKPDNERLVNLISDFLSAKGFNEAMNNSLTKGDYYKDYGFNPEESVKILNPLSSELNVMRQDLLFGLLESVRRNINFKSPDIRLYEFGKQYKYNPDSNHSDLSRYSESRHLGLIITGSEKPENWKYENRDSDFHTLKSFFVSLLKKLGIDRKSLKIEEKSETYFNQCLSYRHYNNHIADVGMLNKKVLDDFEIEVPVFYANINWDNLIKLAAEVRIGFTELPKFPSVRRDLALLIEKSVKFSEIEEIAFKSESKLLKSVNLFDIYEGKGIEKGKKSYAVSFVLRDDSKTLKDKQIDKIMRRIQTNLERNLGAQLR
jgi:phenylalanyl-tRNA synthetase beta chain